MPTNWPDRDDFEALDPIEVEDDLEISAEAFSRLSISPSDWTVGTVYSLIGKQIKLDPEYQRRNVWAQDAKSQFIESLILGIPIPQILLAANASSKNAFLVLDGKQRLSTIKEFIDGHFHDGKTFRLRRLKAIPELNGLSYSDIADTEWHDRLINEPIRTTVLRGWDDEAILYEIFYRLNSGSVRLSPMELRMSLHPGDFMKFIILWTEVIGPLHRLLKKRVPDPRMGDVELAIRFLAFDDRRVRYRGNLKAFLDEYCRLANSDFRSSQFRDIVEDRLDQLNSAINAGFEIFGEYNFCRKFLDDQYESQFNRAVFDVLVYSLADRNVRTWALANSTRFAAAYERVCSTTAFLRAIESTTKSVLATESRFNIWLEEVAQETGLNLPRPNV